MPRLVQSFSPSQTNTRYTASRHVTVGAFHFRSTTPDALISPISIKFGERGYLTCQKHWSQSENDNVAIRMSYDRFSLIAKSSKYSLVVKIRK